MGAARRIWEGPDGLRRLLVPIASLEPFPGNPRKGDVAQIRESLARFGQVAPVVTDPALGADGTRRIVAGHHVVLAAAEAGWTHVAVVENDFGSEDEARAFLLADNHLAELGGYDDELLAAQLTAIRDLGGTGYTEQDRQAGAALLAALRQPAFPETDEVPSLDSRSGTTGVFEVPLLLDRDARKDFAGFVGMLKREWALDDTTSVVLRALREAAARA